MTSIRPPVHEAPSAGAPVATDGSSVDEHACARSWVALARAYEAVARPLAATLRAAADLTGEEFDALLRLQAAGDRGLRLCDLAAPSRLTQPSVSRLVARLEARSWVARCDVPGDGRGTAITLTPAGEAALARAVPAHAACLRAHLLDRLTADEQLALIATLERVARDPIVAREGVDGPEVGG